VSGGVHLTFELQPNPKARLTEIWTVVAQGEIRLGDVRWYAPWRRYTFHPEDKTLYDAECLAALFKFCEKQTQQRKLARAQEKGLPPCMSYCKVGHPHEGECDRMEGR